MFKSIYNIKHLTFITINNSTWNIYTVVLLILRISSCVGHCFYKNWHNICHCLRIFCEQPNLMSRIIVMHQLCLFFFFKWLLWKRRERDDHYIPGDSLTLVAHFLALKKLKFWIFIFLCSSYHKSVFSVSFSFLLRTVFNGRPVTVQILFFFSNRNTMYFT